jgi:hypothetical protein
VKKRTATPPDELISAPEPPTSRHEGNGTDATRLADASAVKIQKRTITFVLTLAVVLGGVLLLLGQNALAKGLLLGALFSALNFFLIALFLPLQIGPGRSRSTFISLASLCLRFILMAIPLIVAAKTTQFEITSTIVGLFMVQIVILADHLWLERQNQLKA